MKLNRRQQKYIAVGLGVYLFEVLVIPAAQALGAGAVLAVGISFWLGLGLSFVLQKTVTFEDRRAHRSILVPQTLAFGVLVVFNFGFTLLLTKLLINTLPAVLIRTVALSITTTWNFYLYKTKIFKNSDEPAVY